MQQIQHNTGELAQSMAAQFRETHRATSGVLVLMIFSVLPLTSLIIGAIRINECSIQRMIPIWLTVIGAAGIVLLSILATLVKTIFQLNRMNVLINNYSILRLLVKISVATRTMKVNVEIIHSYSAYLLLFGLFYSSILLG